MQDADKTQEQLMQELVALRQRCAALQQARIELERRVAERTAELQRAQERFVKAFLASPNYGRALHRRESELSASLGV
jgi:predicted  nucleic acid-binding Zn-ribbon protein